MAVINKTKLPNASFKDVPFLWQNQSVANNGRNTATHEFPDATPQRARFVEDLGASNDIFTVSAQIDYSTDFLARENFIRVLNSEGSGLLILPIGESKEVTVVGYTRNDSKQRLGVSEFNITFEESEKNRFPEIVQGSSGLVSNIKEEVLEENNSFLTNAWRSVKNSKAVFDAGLAKVTQTIEDKQNGIRKVASSVRSQAQGFSQFTASLNNIVNSAAVLIQSPSDLADRFEIAFSNLELAYDSATDLFEVSKGLFGFGAGDVESVGTSSIEEDKTENQTLINNQVSTNALSIGYNAASQIDFQNEEELNRAINDLENGFQLLDTSTLDDDIYQNMLLIRQEANAIFNNLRIGLPRVNTLSFLNARPLSLIVYELYGSLDNLDAIEDLNNFKDTSCVSGDVKVLSAV